MAKTVSIIIQARSTSTRFPKKIFAIIGRKQLLQHVIDGCNNAMSYINKRTREHGIMCNVALAVPYNDELIPKYSKNVIFQGSEDDVLSRYADASRALKSDYVVRITADCPFVPPYIISKAINLMIRDDLDFLSNAHPKNRTFPDGHDVEVISIKLLNWLSENAKTAHDREHVTAYIYSNAPQWAKIGNIIGFVDLFGLGVKLSIDTPADLQNMVEMNDRLITYTINAEKCYRL